MSPAINHQSIHRFLVLGYSPVIDKLFNILCVTELVPSPILDLALDLVQGVTPPILQPRKRQKTAKSLFQTMSLATKLKAGNHLTSKAISTEYLFGF